MNERKKWKKAGAPLRQPAEIERIFNICKECPLFSLEGDNEGECGICGCSIKKSSIKMNKAAWATTTCPHNPPKWIAEVSGDAPGCSKCNKKRKKAAK